MLPHVSLGASQLLKPASTTPRSYPHRSTPLGPFVCGARACSLCSSNLPLFSVGVLFVLCVASPRKKISQGPSFGSCDFEYALFRVPMESFSPYLNPHISAESWRMKTTKRPYFIVALRRFICRSQTYYLLISSPPTASMTS
jgi:hypothetical protein